MKNLQKVGLIILSTIFLFSCVTSKNLPQEIVKKDLPKFEIWKQSYFKELSLEDDIFFFNSQEIEVESDFFKTKTFLEGGVVKKIDTLTNVSNIVLLKTAGKLEKLKKDKEIINIMFISFSQNDINYNFSFFRKNDGSFILNGKAELIYKGKIYPATAKIKGTECLLLFLYENKVVKETIKNTARGW